MKIINNLQNKFSDINNSAQHIIENIKDNQYVTTVKNNTPSYTPFLSVIKTTFPCAIKAHKNFLQALILSCKKIKDLTHITTRERGDIDDTEDTISSCLLNGAKNTGKAIVGIIPFGTTILQKITTR